MTSNNPSRARTNHFHWIRIVQPEQQSLSELPANRLGPGERSVLAYAHRHKVQVVGLDDRQARNLAQRLGLNVTGTLGILLQAKEAGLIPAIHPMLQSIQDEGFFITKALLDYILQNAGEK